MVTASMVLMGLDASVPAGEGAFVATVVAQLSLPPGSVTVTSWGAAAGGRRHILQGDTAVSFVIRARSTTQAAAIQTAVAGLPTTIVAAINARLPAPAVTAAKITSPAVVTALGGNATITRAPSDAPPMVWVAVLFSLAVAAIAVCAGLQMMTAVSEERRIVRRKWETMRM